MKEEEVKRATKTKPIVRAKKKSVGRPVKDLELSDIRTKLLESISMIQKYKKLYPNKPVFRFNNAIRALDRCVKRLLKD